MLAMPGLSIAQSKSQNQSDSLEKAARQAARQNDAKVLSARTEKKGGQNVHQIKVLTNKGVVKTVRVPADKEKPASKKKKK